MCISIHLSETHFVEDEYISACLVVSPKPSFSIEVLNSNCYSGDSWRLYSEPQTFLFSCIPSCFYPFLELLHSLQEYL